MPTPKTYHYRRSSYWGPRHWIVIADGHTELGRISRADNDTWSAYDGTGLGRQSIEVGTNLSRREDAARLLDAVWTERRRYDTPPLDTLLSMVETARADIAYDKNVDYYERGHDERAGIDDAFDRLAESIKAQIQIRKGRKDTTVIEADLSKES
jgi:hypothetical protein